VCVAVSYRVNHCGYVFNHNACMRVHLRVSVCLSGCVNIDVCSEVAVVSRPPKLLGLF